MSKKHSITYNGSLNTLPRPSNLVFSDTTTAPHLKIGDHVLDAETLDELFTLLDAVRMLDHDSPLKRALIAARTKRRLTDGHTKTG